ncbi:hypothetical protein HK101_001797 [Irineochytrium annulatum]|nr:hypothetical protein HK101_001797 [Irineochytrium annulatum]
MPSAHSSNLSARSLRSPADDDAALAGVKRYSLPFSLAITLEIFFTCLVVTCVLLFVSSSNTRTSNAICISSGQTTAAQLAASLQSTTLTVVRLKLDLALSEPISAINESSRLAGLQILQPNEYDKLWKYFYSQIINLDAVSLVYYGDASFGDFVGVRKTNYASPFTYGLNVMDQGAIGNLTNARCQQSCNHNQMNTTGVRYLYTLSATNGGRTPVEGDLISSASYATKGRYWYTLCAAQTLATPSWTPVSVFSNKIDIGITACVPFFDPVTQKLNGVFASDMSFGVLTQELHKLPLTPKGFVIIFNTDGVLYGSSVPTENATYTDSTGNVVFRNISSSPLTDPNSNTALDAIKALVGGDLGKLVTQYPTNTYQTQGLIFQHEIHTDSSGLQLVVVVGAPLTDYTGDLEATQRDLSDRLTTTGSVMMALAVGVLVVLTLVSIPLTWYTLARPLKRLAMHMEEVSRFDFASLHGTDKNERSGIRELGTMQTAYWTMVLAFAKGISDNRRLVQKNSSSMLSTANAVSNRMLLPSALLLAAAAAAPSWALAPLEPADGKMMIGAWYERTLGDTPALMNGRLGGLPGLTFFQTDIDISGKHDPTTGLNITDQFITHLVSTNTNAAGYITIYPYGGFDDVSDAQLTTLANNMIKLVSSGRQLFLRYAPEMNGNWFPYGQDPNAFKASWIRVVTFLRKALGANAANVAFVWAPNSGNGYPYPGGLTYPNITVNPGDQARINTMDTNGDGLLTVLDDPYIPYYPGDEYVDWVGLSMYHYGIQWPWVDNAIPTTDEFEGLLNGKTKPEYGTFPFYDAFCSSAPPQFNYPTPNMVYSAGSKPFIVAETGATYHYAWSDAGIAAGKTGPIPPGASRLEIKQAWWTSLFGEETRTKYPMIKAACSFEFIKSEELTLRDFSMFGCPTPAQGFVEEDKVVSSAFVAAASNWSFIEWAKPFTTTVAGVSTATATSAAATSAAAAATTAAVVAPVNVQTSAPSQQQATNKNAATAGRGFGLGGCLLAAAFGAAMGLAVIV